MAEERRVGEEERKIESVREPFLERDKEVEQMRRAREKERELLRDCMTSSLFILVL
jgi:hypothetical protein